MEHCAWHMLNSQRIVVYPPPLPPPPLPHHHPHSCHPPHPHQNGAILRSDWVSRGVGGSTVTELRASLRCRHK